MTLAVALLFAASAPAIQSIESCPAEVVGPAREFAGVYLDDFEGQRFFEGAVSMADVDRRARSETWLSFEVADLGRPFGIDRRPPYTAYRVRFIGAHRTRGVAGPPCGYGHMNGSGAAIRLERLLAIERLGSSIAR